MGAVDLRGGWRWAVIVAATLLVVLDAPIVNIALPHAKTALHISRAVSLGQAETGRVITAAALTLALDIDVVRAMLGRWLDEPDESGLLARRMAVEMGRVQLLGGRDVVIPQFLGRLEFVLVLQRLCDDVGAEFVEVVLLSDPQDAAERFTRRSAQPETAEHQNAAALLERRGGLDALPGMYDRLLQVVAARPRTRVVLTVDGEVERAYHDLLTRIST